MNLSQKRRSEIYAVIHERVMQARIDLQRDYDVTSDVDYRIYSMVDPIYHDVLKVFNAGQNHQQKGQGDE